MQIGNTCGSGSSASEVWTTCSRFRPICCRRSSTIADWWRPSRAAPSYWRRVSGSRIWRRRAGTGTRRGPRWGSGTWVVWCDVSCWVRTAEAGRWWPGANRWRSIGRTPRAPFCRFSRSEACRGRREVYGRSRELSATWSAWATGSAAAVIS